MPSLKKKKKSSHLSKTSRHQSKYSSQTGREIPSFYRDANFETSRLKCQTLDSAKYDESDAIWFRANLLRNLVLSSDYMNALTTQPIPISMIKAPAIFPGYNSETTSREDTQAILTGLQNSLDNEIQSLNALKKAYEELSSSREGTSGLESLCEEFLPKTQGTDGLKSSPLSPPLVTLDSKKAIDKILHNYLKKYRLRAQEGKVVLHRDKLLNLQLDTRRAPDDYWETKHYYMQASAVQQTGSTPRTVPEGEDRMDTLTAIKSDSGDNGVGLIYQNGDHNRSPEQNHIQAQAQAQSQTNEAVDRNLAQIQQTERPAAIINRTSETSEPYGDFGTGTYNGAGNSGTITADSNVPTGNLVTTTDDNMNMETAINNTANLPSDGARALGGSELREDSKPLMTTVSEQLDDMQGRESQSENMFGDMFVDYSGGTENLDPTGANGDNQVNEMVVGPDVGISDPDGLEANNMLDDSSNIYQNFNDDIIANQNLDSGELGVDIDEPFTNAFDDGFADLDNVFF